VRRYLRLLRLFGANSLQLELEYRANLLFNMLNSLLATAAGVVVLVVMFENAAELGGWTFREVVTLFGVFLVFEALIDIFLYPNLNKLPEYIRKGNMDFFLLKPVSARFLVSFRYLSLWMLPQLFLGLGVVGYGMARGGLLTLGTVGLTAMLLVSGAVIVYSIWFALSITAFWLVKVGNISELFYAFFSAGRFPVSAFPAWARFVLTFLVPIAFITTVPASAAVGRLGWELALGSIALAAVLFFASHALWRFAVASYSSASS
jgi:ABC-2 type transport system permease protein